MLSAVTPAVWRGCAPGVPGRPRPVSLGQAGRSAPPVRVAERWGQEHQESRQAVSCREAQSLRLTWRPLRGTACSRSFDPIPALVRDGALPLLLAPPLL